MEVCPLHLKCLQVESWRVHKLDSGPFNVSTVLKDDQVWPSMDVLLEVLTHPPHVALSINDSRALEDDILPTDDPKESFVLGVQLVPFRHKESTIEL